MIFRIILNWQIISRTNASYDGGIFLTGINQILGPHQSLATIVLVFILTVKNIGPANNISRTNCAPSLIDDV